METTNIIEAIQYCTGGPEISSAFQSGLTFGAGVAAVCLTLSMIRVIGGSSAEDI